jgi:hypothetical protein
MMKLANGTIHTYKSRLLNKMAAQKQTNISMDEIMKKIDLLMDLASMLSVEELANLVKQLKIMSDEKGNNDRNN